MSEVPEPQTPEPKLKPWYRQELTLFVAGSLVIAFCLVLVSMALYVSSGAAQLDLSRPGYKSVRSEVESDAFEGFPSDGPVTRDTLEQFQRLYDTQTKPVTDKDVFSPSALDDEALGVDDVPAKK